MRSFLAIGLLASLPALGYSDDREPPDRALTFSEQRVLDGVYLYLVSPDYCEPSLVAGQLQFWMASQIETLGIPVEQAADYLAKNEARLRQIAEAAFTGRRRGELCQSILLEGRAATGGQAPD